MNALLLRNLQMRKSVSLQSFKEYRASEAQNTQHTSVTSDGMLLEYETLELRLHPPNVQVDNETFADQTVITIDSANRPGTLIEVVQLLTELNLSIRRARISSDGGWFVDEFFVTETPKGKVTDPRKLAMIKKVLSVDAETAAYGAKDAMAYTVFELAGKDQHGLMSAVMRLLTEAGCEVQSAAVWTYHAQVALVVSCTERGVPLGEGPKMQRLQSVLFDMLGGGDAIVNVETVRGEIHHERRLHHLLLLEELKSWEAQNPQSEDDVMLLPAAATSGTVGVGTSPLMGTTTSGDVRRATSFMRHSSTGGSFLGLSHMGGNGGPGSGTLSPEPSSGNLVGAGAASVPVVSGFSVNPGSGGSGTPVPGLAEAAAAAQGLQVLLPGAEDSPVAGAAPGAVSGASGVLGGVAGAPASAPSTPPHQPSTPDRSGPPSSGGAGPHTAGSAELQRSSTMASTSSSIGGGFGGASGTASGGSSLLVAPTAVPASDMHTMSMEALARYMRADVKIQHSPLLKYLLVTIGCKDRNKLFFDTVCTLADMNYDVYHGTIDSEGDAASQLFYVRPRYGECVWDEKRCMKLRYMLECAVQRRFPKGLRLLLQVADRAYMYRIFDGLSTAGFWLTRAEVRSPGDVLLYDLSYTDSTGQLATPQALQRACESCGGVLVDEMDLHSASPLLTSPPVGSLPRTGSNLRPPTGLGGGASGGMSAAGGGAPRFVFSFNEKRWTRGMSMSGQQQQLMAPAGSAPPLGAHHGVAASSGASLSSILPM